MKPELQEFYYKLLTKVFIPKYSLKLLNKQKFPSKSNRPTRLLEGKDLVTERQNTSGPGTFDFVFHASRRVGRIIPQLLTSPTDSGKFTLAIISGSFLCLWVEFGDFTLTFPVNPD